MCSIEPLTLQVQRDFCCQSLILAPIIGSIGTKAFAVKHSIKPVRGAKRHATRHGSQTFEAELHSQREWLHANALIKVPAQHGARTREAFDQIDLGNVNII